VEGWRNELGQLIHETGLSFESIAAKCGMAKDSVRRWVKGSVTPSRDNWRKVKSFLEESLQRKLVLDPYSIPLGPDQIEVADPNGYEPRDSFMLYKWTAEQCFRHDLRRVVRDDSGSEARVEAFFDFKSWQRRAREQTLDGDIYYLTGFDYDDLDDDKLTKFRVTATQYRYAITTQQMFNEVRRSREKAARILQSDGAWTFTRYSPPNNLYVNCSIIDRNDQLLALERASTTHDTNNVWTLGPCETMRREADDEVQDRPMQIDELTRKCLRKEAGLLPPDYGPISVSWIGYNFWTPRPGATWARENWPGANVRIHTQVRSTLSCAEIWDRMLTSAPDGVEHSRYASLAFDAASCLDVINSASAGKPDVHDRIWVQFSALAAAELWRNRDQRWLRDAASL
jgi:hypothetical protein